MLRTFVEQDAMCRRLVIACLQLACTKSSTVCAKVASGENETRQNEEDARRICERICHSWKRYEDVNLPQSSPTDLFPGTPSKLVAKVQRIGRTSTCITKTAPTLTALSHHPLCRTQPICALLSIERRSANGAFSSREVQ